MRLQSFTLGFLALALLVQVLAAQAPPRPQPYCIRGVALDRAGERRNTLVLRDGSIEAVLDEAAPPPPGTRVIDGTGLLCLPAFLDAFTRQGCSVPQPVTDQDLPPNALADVGVDMRVANRKGIQPAFRAVEALAITKEQGEAWRKSGFGAALVAPGGQLLSGSSTLASTREAAMRDVVVRDDVFAHAAFAASGAGYPSTLMGYFAQLRQFLLDSRRHAELRSRHEQGRPGPRPAFDAELQAGVQLLRGERRLLCEANSVADIERWLRLAREFELDVDVVGGLEAWRARAELSQLGVTVVLTLDWGKEPEDPAAGDKKSAKEEGEATEAVGESEVKPPSKEKDSADRPWEYTEPKAVRAERRREWEEGRDCARSLHEAGVRFVFGTASEKPSELLGRVRKLVAAGLPPEAALQALTASAADCLGVGDRIGRIEAGYDATFVLWRADPLVDEKASPAWVFVDGHPSEYKEEEKEKKSGVGPAEGVDPSGTWTIDFVVEGEGMRRAELVLEMDEDGSVIGTLEVESPMGGGRVKADVEGDLSGLELELECTLAFGEFKVEASLEGTLSGEKLDGKGTFRGPWSDEPMTQSFTGKRAPKQG
jgi:hypothetical protein